LICSGDYLTHSLEYLQDHEKLRTDVRVVDHLVLQSAWEVRRLARHVPDVRLPGTRLDPRRSQGTFDLAGFMDRNAARFPIFVANGIRIPDDSYQRGYNSWPIGLVQWMLPKNRELDYEDWLRRDAEALVRYSPPAPDRYPEDSWEHEVLRQYWFARY